jgi:hypothetical protein
MRFYPTSYNLSLDNELSFRTGISIPPEATLSMEFRGDPKSMSKFAESMRVGNDLSDFLPVGDVIVKCDHCGQWGARKTACKSCGAPID